MSDKENPTKPGWMNESKDFLDKGLENIDETTLQRLQSIRHQSLHGRIKHSTWMRGGFASAASIVLAVGLFMYLDKKYVDNPAEELPIDTSRVISESEISGIVEHMELLEDYEMLAAMGELDSEA